MATTPINIRNFKDNQIITAAQLERLQKEVPEGFKPVIMNPEYQTPGWDGGEANYQPGQIAWWTPSNPMTYGLSYVPIWDTPAGLTKEVEGGGIQYYFNGRRVEPVRGNNGPGGISGYAYIDNNNYFDDGSGGDGSSHVSRPRTMAFTYGKPTKYQIEQAGEYNWKEENAKNKGGFGEFLRNFAMAAGVASGVNGLLSGTGLFGGAAAGGGDVAGLMSGLGDTVADIAAQELVSAGMPLDLAVKTATDLANAGLSGETLNQVIAQKAAEYSESVAKNMFDVPEIMGPPTDLAPPGTTPDAPMGPPADLATPPGGTPTLPAIPSIPTIPNTGSPTTVPSGTPVPPGLLNDLSKYLGVSEATLTSLFGTGLTGLASYLASGSQSDAAKELADAQLEAARIAADAAKFRPVGVKTRFGESKFGYDANGNLTSAGYTLDPTLKAQQDRLMGLTGDYLTQYEGAIDATAPMGTAAQRAMELGQGYLQRTPQEQAAQYMEEQQALLSPYRERELAQLENRLRQQGRLGLATGGTTSGMLAANPELDAWKNAKMMEDLNLAARSTQGGMDYAKFGAGLVGTGGDLLSSMYGVQSAAYNPYQTAMGGAAYLEGLGQQPMDMGINIGAKGTAANASSAGLLAQGMNNAASTMYPSNASNPWANFLGNLGGQIGQYGQSQPQGTSWYDPTKFRLTPIT